VSEATRRTQQRVATIHRVRDFLAEHITDVPAFRDLATMAGMSRSHFSRTFHAVMGESLRQYVVHRRVDRARQLLAWSPLSVTAIAFECGFYDLPHMDKAFRRRFGVSPCMFRHRPEAAATSSGGVSRAALPT
jgi:AraC family transcriptional regulator